MTENEIYQNADEYLIPFLKRFKMVFTKGSGHTLWDVNGRKYIDFSAGIAVTNFGHANPTINRAVKKQLGRILHISNAFYIPQQAELAKAIGEKSFKGKSFFFNSGAEANEAAIKLARLIGNKKADGKNKILALQGSFHGRTVATVSMTGQEKYRKGFEPLLPNVDFVEFNDTADLEAKFDDSVCAIIIEAIQGEGGVRSVSIEFMSKADELSKKHDALLVFDEVQAGIGRTGKYFGYQWYFIRPDMITIAKGLGNGFPIGALHIRPELAEEIPYGFHSSTFGGNYIATTAGIAVMKLLNKKTLDKINKVSDYIETKFEALKTKKPGKIGEIRIRGLMIGADIIDTDVSEIILKLFDKGFVTLRAGTNTLRLVPPFTITEKEIDKLMDALEVLL